ncbi:MAG: polyphenol oxidase family protein [Acidobacteriota bacterium]
MPSKVKHEPPGPFLDLSKWFPPDVFAYVLLNGRFDLSPSGLRRFLLKKGHRNDSVMRPVQIHSAKVETAQPGRIECDALVTARPGTAVAVVTADCVPLLLAGENGKRAAAVHAGWKGTLAGIALRALEKMGSPETVTAYLGPAVGRCCYRVGADRYALFREAFPEQVAPLEPGESPALDLAAVNAGLLISGGVRAESVRVESRCTSCHRECCSYRRDGEAAGRMVSLIGIEAP